ncbi:MAG: hypothetical protein ACM3S4_00885, partial [Burkholderiales bacterium]
TALSEMGQQLSIAGLGTKIAPPVLEGELCQKCNRSIDNVDNSINSDFTDFFNNDILDVITS